MEITLGRIMIITDGEQMNTHLNLVSSLCFFIYHSKGFSLSYQTRLPIEAYWSDQSSIQPEQASLA
jgi:hypothetical protein